MLAWLMETGRTPAFSDRRHWRSQSYRASFTDSYFSVLRRRASRNWWSSTTWNLTTRDIYHSLEEIKLSFRRLTQIIPRNGLALVNADDPNCLDVVKGAPCPVKTVGFSDFFQHPHPGCGDSHGRQPFHAGRNQVLCTDDWGVQHPQRRHGDCRRTIRGAERQAAGGFHEPL